VVGVEVVVVGELETLGTGEEACEDVAEDGESDESDAGAKSEEESIVDAIVNPC
jgi:hypothetical protein